MTGRGADTVPGVRRAGCRRRAPHGAVAVLLVGVTLSVLGAAVTVALRGPQGVALQVPRTDVAVPGSAVADRPPRAVHTGEPSASAPVAEAPPRLLAPAVPLSELVPAPLIRPAQRTATPSKPPQGPDQAAASLTATRAVDEVAGEPRDGGGTRPGEESEIAEPQPAGTADPAPDGDTVTATRDGDATPGGVRVERPGPVALPTVVEVPATGVRAPVIGLGVDGEGRLEVPADPQVAGWWTGGPAPGADGPAVIVGHVDSYRGPGVFFRLSELTRGDRIVVRGEDGSAAHFAVDRLERWPKDAFPTDAVYRQADGAELRLITCGGEFDRQERRYLDNIIVFARATDP